eukprot:Polyplicarium_translucidae@DN1731_c0_g1_i2.p2
MIEAKSKALSAVRFVDPHVTLATAGASDGVIRLWDIRKPRTAFFAFTSSGSATKAQEDGGSQRGVVWMDVDDLHRHLAVKHTDSRVTVYDARSLAIDSLRALRKCNLHMPISPDRHGGDNSHLKPCLSGCGAHSLESPRKSTIPHAPFLFSQTSHQASATPRRSVGTSVLCSDEANAPPRPRKKRSLCEG